MYNSYNISDRIKKTAVNQNVSVKKLLNDVGLGFNTMSNMKTSMPKADNLAKIADYLDCSVDYLLGRTENPQSHKGVSAVSNKIAAKLSDLNDEAAEKVIESRFNMDKQKLITEIDDGLDALAKIGNDNSLKKGVDTDTMTLIDETTKKVYEAIDAVANAVKAILETM